MKNTPMLWKTINGYEVVTHNNRFIATCLDGSGLEGIQDKRNAELIVRAVNNYEAMVGALKTLRILVANGVTMTEDELDQLDALIEQAETGRAI